MKTKAVRLYGKMDLRLDEFDLPEIKDDEILARVSADSVCMSSYKAALLGAEHKRVPDDVADHPIIVGHEMAGELVQIGSRWADEFKPGEHFSLQPAINYKGRMDSPGYSYAYCGGDATYMIIPPEVMIMNCLLHYRGTGWFQAALAEPYSCVIGACRALYRTDRQNHNHYMGIKDGGRMAIIGGCGPMGLAAIDYALSGEFRPRQLVVTDVDTPRLNRAQSMFAKKAEANGIALFFINTAELENARESLMQLTENEGFCDMLVMVAHPQVLEFSESLLAFNGCLNFFAGPTDQQFSAKINYYDVHYMEKHIIGTTGGNVDDMREALELMAENRLCPEVLVTHIGGLDAAADATLNLPSIPGGKKLIYTGISMPLIALSDLAGKADDPFYKELAEIVERNNGLWSTDAETYLLKNGQPI